MLLWRSRLAAAKAGSLLEWQQRGSRRCGSTDAGSSRHRAGMRGVATLLGAWLSAGALHACRNQPSAPAVPAGV